MILQQKKKKKAENDLDSLLAQSAQMQVRHIYAALE